MKKLKIKIIIFIMLLALPISYVNAASPKVNSDDWNYEYNLFESSLSSLGINNVPSSACANKGQCHTFSNKTFFFHEAVGTTYKFQGYCLHIGKTAHDIDPNGYPKLKAYKTLDKVVNNSNKALSASQQTLLENLLSNGFHLNSTFKETINSASKSERLKMVATQILVWEVVEGGRTSFDSIKPNVYNGSESLYSKLVLKNKDSLYTAYENIVGNVQDATEESKTPSAISNYNSADKAYVMQYSVKNQNYTVTTGSLGKFDTVSSSDGITTSITSKKLKMTSKYFEGTKKIVLSYTAGSTDTNLNDFYYFKFKLCDSNGKNCSVPKNWQDIILGAKRKVYKKEIYVRCAKGAFKINKIDGKTGEAVSGTTFEIRNSSGTPLRFNQSGATFVYNVSGSITSLIQPTANVYQITNMPSGEYFVVETATDGKHALAVNEADRTIKIKIEGEKFYQFDKTQNRYIERDEGIITIPNYVTQVQILKSGSAGILLNGVQFRLFDSTKNSAIPLSFNSTTGIYSYDLSDGDDSIILETNTSGKVVIEGLPFGKYMLQEIKTLEGYTIQNEWYTINVTSTTSSEIPYILSITNAKGEFNFYKMDENGNYLTGGTFKIQKYDSDTGKYVDQGITEIDSSNANTNIYKIDSNANNYTFQTKKGIATFQEVEANAKYKIVELEAPNGYQTIDLETDNAIVEIDSAGYAKNSATIINKSIIIETDASSNAELIVNIRTGQVVIKYGIIIGAIIIIIGILLFLKKKLGK